MIAFVGDVHGRIFHAFAALLELQARLGHGFDAIIQVGDLGYPDLERADEPTRRYLAVDPAEGELAPLMERASDQDEALKSIRTKLGTPMLFVRGNHEDFDWLRGLPVDDISRTAPIDPFDLLRYVPDGAVLDLAGARIAFLGGVEEFEGPPGIDDAAYQSLLDRGPGTLNVLVTHEGPYGCSQGYRGDIGGSRRISQLVEALQPSFHVFGHAHQPIGPAKAGRTTYLGLDGLVASRLWHPEEGGLKSGCFGLLDIAEGELRPITDAWLKAFPTPFDTDGWLGRQPGS